MQTAALALLLAAPNASGFTTTSGLKSRTSTFVAPTLNTVTTTVRPMIGGFFNSDGKTSDLDPLIDEGCRITPEGYGFSSPVERILKNAGRGSGFYRADASESVVDVISVITEGDQDVALVYNGDGLLGIFTETDYIKVRCSVTCRSFVAVTSLLV
jgi:hypothetical protein